jgi:hypothetical protein
MQQPQHLGHLRSFLAQGAEPIRGGKPLRLMPGTKWPYVGWPRGGRPTQPDVGWPRAGANPAGKGGGQLAGIGHWKTIPDVDSIIYRLRDRGVVHMRGTTSVEFSIPGFRDYVCQVTHSSS